MRSEEIRATLESAGAKKITDVKRGTPRILASKIEFLDEYWDRVGFELAEDGTVVGIRFEGSVSNDPSRLEALSRKLVARFEQEHGPATLEEITWREESAIFGAISHHATLWASPTIPGVIRQMRAEKEADKAALGGSVHLFFGVLSPDPQDPPEVRKATDRLLGDHR
jgi:hypothetical protein